MSDQPNSRIPTSIPQIGPGTLAILRAKGIFSSTDLLLNADQLEPIPGIGPGRAALLVEWAENCEPGLSALLSGRTQVAPESQVLLASHPVDHVRLMLAERIAFTFRPNLQALAVLSKDKNAKVRLLIAKKRVTPAEVLDYLSRDSDAGVRKAVAGNRSTPAHVLAHLASDEDETVRTGIAANESTPQEVLQVLAKENSHIVRRAASLNSSLPNEVLLALSSDPDDSIRKEVGSRLAPKLQVGVSSEMVSGKTDEHAGQQSNIRQNSGCASAILLVLLPASLIASIAVGLP